MLTSFSDGRELANCDICVVGAGPVGIAFALGCEDRGLSVLLLESGVERPSSFATGLTAGHTVNRPRHADPDVAICRGLGGTSRWWAGRCVPFDDVDFALRRHAPGTAWPFSHDELSRWYPAAADFFDIGPARFVREVAPWTKLADTRFDQLERWTPQTDAGMRHRARLASSSQITTVLGATVTEIELSAAGDRVTGLIVADSHRSVRIRPRTVVLACGGLETTRLLLATQDRWPSAFGGREGPLGRGYMGHLSGKIADLILADAQSAAAHDFFLDEGAFARRRFTLTPAIQLEEHLLNVAFWADNPPFHRPEHRSGILSLVWMVLAIPPIGRALLSEGIRLSHVGPRPRRWLEHARNVACSPCATAVAIASILWARYLSSPRKPGFLVINRGGRYSLHFVAEQTPNASSTVTLSDARDALGLRFLKVDLVFSETDARSVLRAHQLLDRSLQQARLGRLEYYETDPAKRLDSILTQAADGFHQFGTTRMAKAPDEGVVDADCRVHGVVNLYLASTSVFPSSGQANPTFVAVALALRLAAHLGRLAARDDSGKPIERHQEVAA